MLKFLEKSTRIGKNNSCNSKLHKNGSFYESMNDQYRSMLPDCRGDRYHHPHSDQKIKGFWDVIEHSLSSNTVILPLISPSTLRNVNELSEINRYVFLTLSSVTVTVNITLTVNGTVTVL